MYMVARDSETPELVADSVEKVQGVYQLLPRTGLAQGASPGTRIKPLLHACIKKPVVLPLRGKVQCPDLRAAILFTPKTTIVLQCAELHLGQAVRHAPGDKVDRTGLLPVRTDPARDLQLLVRIEEEVAEIHSRE